MAKAKAYVTAHRLKLGGEYKSPGTVITKKMCSDADADFDDLVNRGVLVAGSAAEAADDAGE